MIVCDLLGVVFVDLYGVCLLGIMLLVLEMVGVEFVLC